MIVLVLVGYLLWLGAVCFLTFIITLIIQLFRIRKMSREIYPGLEVLKEMHDVSGNQNDYIVNLSDNDISNHSETINSLEQKCAEDSVCQFFDGNLKPLNIGEFVQRYNESYFIGGGKMVAGVQQNSRFVENEIEQLLREGIKTEEDVFRLLAWKTGAIRQVKSENEKKFIYNSGTDVIKGVLQPPLRQPIYTKEFTKCITDNIVELEHMAQTDPQRAINYLKDNAPKGIGTVYILAVLYFISRGKYPIYDKFAMVAINAIVQGKKPGEEITYCDLPVKDSMAFNQIVDNYRNIYVKKIEFIFGSDYYISRDIDRALWVYGHSFRILTG